MYGSIEFGGTKIRCAVFDKDGEILETTWIDTTNPKDNMEKIGEFYQKNPVEKLGVGAFGPIDLNEKSKNYGLIENTPKEKWQGFDLLGNLKKNVCQNVGLVTDVGLSLIGEDMKGASQDLKSSIYDNMNCIFKNN